MKFPKVSVIIPFYNVEKYIGECLDSVLNQTLREIEIICVSDGSTDNSTNIVEEYIKTNKNIKLIKKENGGQSSARNKALNVARGEYVMFLDSDDYIDSNTLEVTYKRAMENDLDIVFFDGDSFFETEDLKERYKKFINNYKRKERYDDIYTGQALFALMRKKREFSVSPCMEVFRRSFLENNHLSFYEGIIHEDNLFTFQCVMLAKRVAHINQVFYFRRIREESTVTKKMSMKNVEGYLVSYTEILSFLRQCNIEENVKPQILDFLYNGLYKNAYKDLQLLDIADAEKYLTKGDICAEHFLEIMKFHQNIHNKEIAKLQKQINDIKSSKSFRIGKILTFIPGKIKRLILK